MKNAEAPNIEIEVEDCEEYTTTFSFYVISGRILEPLETSPMKEDVAVS